MTTPEPTPEPPASTDEPVVDPARRRWSRVITAWFAVLILIPAILTVSGVRSTATQNRAPTALPHLSLRSLGAPKTYQQISGALDDHLPGRDQAVDASRALDLDVLGDSPTHTVVFGDDDTLFLTDTWELVCDEPQTPAQLSLRIGQVAEGLAARGPDVRVLLVPDKTFVLGDELGDHPGRRCADERRAAYRATDHHPSVIDAYPAFSATARRGTRTFWKGDSHTNFAGEAILERELVDSLQPGLWEQVPRVDAGEVGVFMDLWQLVGEDRGEHGMATVASRPDITTVARSWNADDPPPADFVPLESLSIPSVPSIVAEFRTTGSGAVIEGDTLIIGDSQMQRIAANLAPYFRHLTVRLYPGLGFEMPSVAEDVASSDHVVIETVERGAYRRFFNGTIDDRLGLDG